MLFLDESFSFFQEDNAVPTVIFRKVTKIRLIIIFP